MVNGRAAALRIAATGVAAAWDSPDRDGLDEAIATLRTALSAPPARQAREPGALRRPRVGTKQETVLTLLRRDQGTTIAEIIEATGWQPHTVRGFLAGLKRKGVTVEVLERVRQVGPSKQGAKGSYSIYRIYAAMAQKERELISARTKAALAAARRAGRSWAGIGDIGPRKGRTRLLPQRRGVRRLGRRIGCTWKLNS
ncbi:DUF3489 domain-containing protein [Roseomonas sp. CAU 1739]|uniref:DUF3489 domain-containing protein n=1 Tax=Roseomonas sp. CAU 1739 TaxID=3140364 RepID=UPI00325BA631